MRLERTLGQQEFRGELFALGVEAAAVFHGPAGGVEVHPRCAALCDPVRSHRSPEVSTPVRTLPATDGRGTARAARPRPATAPRAPSFQNSGTPNAFADKEPYIRFLLVHSKSKAIVNASRKRRSSNLSRLVLSSQPCAPDGRSSGNDVPLDASVAKRGKSCARVAQTRECELFAEQIIAAGKGLEAGFAIPVILVPQNIEIAQAARNREAFRPPVLHALELDVTAPCSKRATR